MESQPPHLQMSDTDGIGPVKRRRPALSCVECRRRKVKCDREKPCGPCTRTKSSTCTYRPNTRQTSRPTKSPSTTSVDHDHLDHGSEQAAAQSNDFDLPMDRYPMPGALRLHESAKQNLHIRTNSEGTDSANTITSLVEKVRELETRLNEKDSTTSWGTGSSKQHTPSEIPGQFAKFRFYGESHWVNAIEPYEALGNSCIINSNTNRTEINKSSELYALILECKKMARTVKSARTLRPSLPPEIHSSIPSKAICDKLIQCYLRTFEGVFRVLHVPTFMKEYEEYWEFPDTSKSSVLTKILLACAIGVPFYTGEEQPRLRATCKKWILAAEYWLSAPQEKSRLNLTGLQIQILLLLARMTCRVDGDLIWIPAGALLRSAMHIGLHRDPSHFGNISPFNAEIRRRLWATVLELTVQTSLDMGMPPMISMQDFDTRPPSNLNDEDIKENDTTLPQPKPQNQFTRTSIQIAFLDSLSLRLDITRLVNNLYSTLSYDDTLNLGNELATMCRRKMHIFQGFLASNSGINPFQIKSLDTFVRRFILCLHRPFFTKSKLEPKYYYSRKVCLDTSMAIMQTLSVGPNSQEDDWVRLITNCVGFVKSVFLFSITTIYLELLGQIQEQQNEIGPFSAGTSASDQNQVPTPRPPQFDMLRNVLVNAQYFTVARIRNGETNGKGAVFLDCALARIDALVSNTDPNVAVLDAARKSIAESTTLMRQGYKEEWGVDIDIDLHLGFDIEHGGVDVSAVDDSTSTVGMRSRNNSNIGEVGFENMDWETLMHDDGMDFGFGFEGGPENWIFGGLESHSSPN